MGIKKKIVFRESIDSSPKVVFGTVKDLNDGFIEVTASSGVFTINKNSIIFIKDGDY